MSASRLALLRAPAPLVARGRTVATLVDGLETAGRKSAVWKGIDDVGNPVASGIYFCRMNAGGQEQKVKMMLMK